MIDRIGKAKYFPNLELETVFCQIRIAPQDIEKTAFKTEYGQFEFLVMPVGLRNSPATFLSLMNPIFFDCIDKILIIYLDDILVFSSSLKGHTRHVKLVQDKLWKHKLYLGNNKFELYKTKTDFFILQLGKIGVFVSDERKRIILESGQNLQLLLNWEVFLDKYNFSQN